MTCHHGATVSVSLSAEEISERVSDALAWQAVAWEGRPPVVADAFRRAELMVAVGVHDWARMTVRGVEQEPGPLGSLLSLVCPTCDDRDASNRVYALHRAVGWLSPTALIRESDGTHGNTTYMAVGVCQSDNRRQRAIHGFPQAAPVFVSQSLYVASDAKIDASVDLSSLVGNRLVHHTGNVLGAHSEVLCDVHCALALAVDRRASWPVDVSMSPDRPGVALPTDYTGAVDYVDRMRREVSTTGRRKALIHWVRDHFRRRRAGDDPSILVRKHLRGEVAVSMTGHHVRIWPSKADVDMLPTGAAKRKHTP